MKKNKYELSLAEIALAIFFILLIGKLLGWW